MNEEPKKGSIRFWSLLSLLLAGVGGVTVKVFAPEVNIQVVTSTPTYLNAAGSKGSPKLKECGR